MSKQINFYMDKDTECRFINFIIENDYVVIDNNGNILDIQHCNDLNILITKKTYLSNIEYKYDTVDVLKSLVIDYMRNNIIEEKKCVTRGRLWIGNACNKLHYSSYGNTFKEDYSNLCKWIKKNVPKQFFYNRGIQEKGYISDGLLLYSEKGYQFL